jgi:small subunit ribosomal protein S1
MKLFSSSSTTVTTDDEPDTMPMTETNASLTDAPGATFHDLLVEKGSLEIPKSGEIVTGTVVAIGRNEVKIDIPGYRTGLVRGPELIDPSGKTTNIAVGEEVEATVMDLENERGFVELSFRAAGHQKAWSELAEQRRAGTISSVRVLDANRGGLVVQFGNMQGFLPVSQLSPGNYPRVTGGDKTKILEKLRSFAGRAFDVKIIDLDPIEEKLIVSEKAAWEELQSKVLESFTAGQTIDGIVTALTDFGAFVRFPLTEEGTIVENFLEGLIHISELSWKRVDHPRNVLALEDRVNVEIINIEGSKIFLSLKRLSSDPWSEVADRYTVGQQVTGKVVKAQPFGVFVELEPEIHGLAHISELSHPPPKDPEEVVGVGDTKTFTIISFDPKQHRLGLSLMASPHTNQPPKTEDAKPDDTAPSEDTDTPSAEAPTSKDEPAPEEKPEETSDDAAPDASTEEAT